MSIKLSHDPGASRTCSFCERHDATSLFEGRSICRHCLYKLAAHSMAHYMLSMYDTYSKFTKSRTAEDNNIVLNDMVRDAQKILLAYGIPAGKDND